MKPSLLTYGCRLLVFAALMSQLFVATKPTAADSSLDVLINSMTLEDRVGQLFMVCFWGKTANSSLEQLIASIHPGGVVLVPENLDTPEQITRLTNGLQTQATTHNAQIPLLIAVDQEGGTVQRLRNGFTDLPDPLVLGAVSDPAIIHDYGAMVGQELSAVGINMNMAPVVDLLTNPANPIVAYRTMGDDPHRVSQAASTFIAGMANKNVVGVIKHFPGHGDVTDTHVDTGILPYNREALNARELIPFFTANTPIIMMGHITAPALDPNNLPATLSPAMVNILRQDGGFNGVIMTDAMDMGAIVNHYDYPTAVTMSVQAGVDLVLMGANTSPLLQMAAYNAVLNAVKTGKISEQRINESVKRLLMLKNNYGLLQWSPLNDHDAQNRVAQSNSSAVLTRTYTAGVTLVQNTNNTLPIQTSRRVGLIYPNVYGDILTTCQAQAAAVNQKLQGLSISFLPYAYEIGNATRLAQQSDMIIVFTESADVNLAQQTLVTSLPPQKTIVVALGSPFDLKTFPNVSGYLLGYDPVKPAFTATCKLIFGEQPALGVLPVMLSPTLRAGTSANIQ